MSVTDADVRRAQVRMLAMCHPDRHPEGPAREAAMRASARVNEAVAALASEELRAEAFVRAAGGGDAVPALPQAELMEWLERREWIEEQQAAGDGGRGEIVQWRRTALSGIVHEIRTAACDEAGMPRPDADWAAARLAVARLRALRRACGVGVGRV